MKDLFSLLKSSNIGNLFPELTKPFNGLIKDIITVKKLYKDLSTQISKTKFEKEKSIKKKKDNTKPHIKKEVNSNKKNKQHNKNNNDNKKVHVRQASVKKHNKNDKINKLQTNNKNSKIKRFDNKAKIKDDNAPNFTFNNLIKVISRAKNKLIDFKKSSQGSLSGVEKSAEVLSVNGGKSLLNFALKGAAHIGMFVTAAIAAVLAIKRIGNFLNELGKQDVEYEKLSRQLWTTKENAKDIDGALKTLGVTMQDLWLSPTLLKQFNQLRKDSAQLRLPPEFKDNIKVIQGLGLEFKRLKQFGKLAFQWIGNYILKYVAGPLAEFKQKLSGFNDKLIKVIPYIAKVIGSAIGIVLRVLLLISKVLTVIFKLSILPKRITIKLLYKIIELINKIPSPIKKILKIIGVIAALIIAGPVGAIILVLGLLDDLFTSLRGGKSIIGSVFGYFKEKGSNAIESIKSKFGDLKEKFKNGMSSIKDDWNGYWEKASEVLDKLKEKAKEVWGDIKEWSKGIWDKTKEFFTGDAKSKVEVYNKDIGSSEKVAPQYTNSSNVANNTTTSNSNNEIKNTNTINVYGNDSKTTADTIDKKLSGINTRNLQGVF